MLIGFTSTVLALLGFTIMLPWHVWKGKNGILISIKRDIHVIFLSLGQCQDTLIFFCIIGY